LAEPSPVWITRAEPGASETARRVAALGLRPLIAPLLTLRDVETSLALQPDEALALTSRQGALRAAALTPRRDMTVFAVGDATAEAARAAGFADVRSASGDVSALAALIAAERPAAVVHPCAAETAGDLIGALAAAGVPARKAIVYETAAAGALPEAVAAAFETGALAAVLFHSPKAGRAAAVLLRAAKVDPGGMSALGLSPACLEGFTAPPWRAVRAAARPNEDALMALLDDLLGDL
jgi:uroporphyrinogen-III synthase